MFQLLYASTVNSKTFGENDISDILRKARSRNPSLGITGILLYRSEIFIQLLEGEREKVLSLYEKIKLDSRHSNVTDIAVIEGGYRLFTHWDMAYRKINDTFDVGVVNQVLSWNNKLQRNQRVTPQQVLGMLSHFREQIDGKTLVHEQVD